MLAKRYVITPGDEFHDERAMDSHSCYAYSDIKGQRQEL